MFFRYDPADPLTSKIANYPEAGPEISEAHLRAIKGFVQDRSADALNVYLREQGLIDAADEMCCKALRPAWESEPDSLDFEHRGIACAIRRMRGTGHLCGYVSLPDDHIWRGCSEYQVPAAVHGGITFGPSPREGKGVWIGFDCAHFGDRMPTVPLDRSGVYRDVAYVKEQCESLAEQVRAAQETV